MFDFFRPGPTIGEWRDAYVDYARKFSHSSYWGKVRAFRYLLDTIPGSLAAKRLSDAKVMAALQQTAKTRNGCAANETRKQLHAAWAWGTTYLGLPEKNPFSGHERFPEDQKPRYVPPLSDYQAVLAQTTEGSMDRVMLIFALHTAARRGEIFRARWMDIDFERRLIRLGTRKRRGGGMEYDYIPMTDTLAETLMSYRQASPHQEILFPSRRGRAYKDRLYWLHALCDTAGVPRFGFHAIRHLSATMMVYGGMAVPSVQAILRHKNMATTIRYLHRIGALQQDLDRVFRGVFERAGTYPLAA